MLQQARRIGDLSTRTTAGGAGGDFRDLATLQCHSYLAAINSLTLVEDQSMAWVLIIFDSKLVRPPPLIP